MSAEPRAVRLGLAFAAGCIASVAAYAILRLLTSLTTAEPDPALVIWSEHAGYFWRALTALYVGGMAGFAAWVAASRDAPRVARWLVRLVTVAAALAILQGVLVP